MMETSVEVECDTHNLEEDDDNNVDVVYVRKPRKPGKRLHRAKRVTIRANEDSQSFLSKSYILATGYKRKIRDLLSNNRMLAKALEESNLRCQLMEKQISEMYRSMSCRNVFNVKMNKVSRNLSEMASTLQESLTLVMDVVNHMNNTEDTTNDIPFNSMSIMSPQQTAPPTSIPLPDGGIEFLFARNTVQYASQLKPPDMSAIEEVSLTLGEHTAKTIPVMFENEDEKEPTVASKTSDGRNRRCSSNGNVKRRSSRRQSSMMSVKSKTPSPSKNCSSPFSETPETPKIHFAANKFKSNIPKPVGLKDAKKLETGSPSKTIISSDTAKIDQEGDADRKTSLQPSEEVKSAKEFANPAKKPLSGIRSKQQGQNSEAKKANSENKGKEKAAAKRKAEKGVADVQSKHKDTNAGFSDVVIPEEYDGSGLNLRRCTYTVPKDLSTGHKEATLDIFPSQESITPPKINRLTIVMHSNKNKCMEGNMVQTVTSDDFSRPADFPQVNKTTNIGLEPSTITAAKEDQSDRKTTCTLGSHQGNNKNLPNITILDTVDMSLTEMLPKEIMCNVMEQIAIDGLQQNFVTISQGVATEETGVENVAKTSLETGIKEAKKCDNPESGKTDKSSAKICSKNELNDGPTEASNREPTGENSEKPSHQECEEIILPSLVSLSRRNSRKKKISSNPATRNKKSNKKFSLSDEEDSDIDLCLDLTRKPLVKQLKESMARPESEAQISSVVANTASKLCVKKHNFLTLSNPEKKLPVKAKDVNTTDRIEKNVFDFNDSGNIEDTPDKKQKKDASHKSTQKSTVSKNAFSNEDDDEDDFYLNFRSKQKKARVIHSGEWVGGKILNQIDPSNQLPVSDRQALKTNGNGDAESLAVKSLTKSRNRKRKTDVQKNDAVVAKSQKSHRIKKSQVSGEGENVTDENSDLPVARPLKKTKERKPTTSSKQITPSSSATKMKEVELKKNSPREREMPVRGKNSPEVSADLDLVENEKKKSRDLVANGQSETVVSTDIVTANAEKVNVDDRRSSGFHLRFSTDTATNGSLAPFEPGRQSIRRRNPVSYKEPPLKTKMRR